MNYQELKNKLSQYGQEDILRFWDELSAEKQESLCSQIEKIDFELLQSLINSIDLEKDSSPRVMQPDTVISLAQRSRLDADMQKQGEQLLREGKVAAFLVAGGQGSRLGYSGPKGIYPITPIKNKSLFHLHAEKIRAMGMYYQTVIPWYIMTSEANHDQTIAFFQENDYFDLGRENIMFFKQEMLPAVDLKGKLILEDKHKLFMSPNGHGGSLKAIYDSGALRDMQQRGIDYLFYFQVDNVLLNICEPAFLGYHLSYQAEMSSKVVRKAYPQEKMGVICRLNGKTGVVEYSDLSEEEMYATNADGELKFWAGSIAVHILNVDFIESENKRGFRLPYHIALKNIPGINALGQPLDAEEKNGYKFETFVFDALAHCKNTISVETARENEFSAVKNGSGVDSPATAKRDLINLYKRWLKEVNISVPDNEHIKIEISPLFAFSPEMLRLKKKLIPKITKDTYLGS